MHICNIYDDGTQASKGSPQLIPKYRQLSLVSINSWGPRLRISRSFSLFCWHAQLKINRDSVARSHKLTEKESYLFPIPSIP